MAEWRKLHSRITRSLDVNELPDDFTRLLWSWLPLACDSAGRCLYHAGLIRSALFPLREDVTIKQVGAGLAALADRGLIMRYRSHDHDYLYIPNWLKYQGSPTSRKEGAPEYPDPQQTESEDGENHSESSPRVVVDSVQEQSALDKTRQDKTREERSSPNGAGVSSLSNAERGLLEAQFCRLTGISPPEPDSATAKRQAAATWWDPLRRMAGLAGNDVVRTETLMAEAWERLKDKVTVSSPKSLLNTATAIAGEWTRNNGHSDGPQVSF